MANGLQEAASGSRDGNALSPDLSAERSHLGRGVVGALFGSIVEELPQRLAKVARDAGHDRCQLDRVRHVVDEVDQHAEVDQRQSECRRHRQMRHELR